MGFFNFGYLLFMLPGLLLSIIASIAVKSAYNKWSQIRNARNVTGLEVADYLKNQNDLNNVRLAQTQGSLSDHYDPRSKTLALSQGVANQPSVAAMAIAAHELGHAQQDKENYVPMRFRRVLVPVVNIGSNIGMILVMAGLILNLLGLATIGIILFASTTLFSLITVPVELNASRRAKVMLERSQLITSEEERKGVNKVLNAAAWTYVAGLVTSIMQLMYYVSLVSGGRRRS
ncbi:MAG: zinc metallopeptidase [Chloroflexi bacterium]|nr:zinc metallopeptidase [Chloroflexota bacterium]